MDLSDSKLGRILACVEVGNKYSGAINTVNFMINCEVILVKKESIPRN